MAKTLSANFHDQLEQIDKEAELCIKIKIYISIALCIRQVKELHFLLASKGKYTKVG